MDSALGRLVENPSDNIAEHWNVLKETIYHAAHNILGKINASTQTGLMRAWSLNKLFFMPKIAHQSLLRNPNLTIKEHSFLSAKSALQRELRVMKGRY